MRVELEYNRYWQEAKSVEALGALPAHVLEAYKDATTLTMWDGFGVESNKGAIAAYGWGGGIRRLQGDSLA